MKQILLLATWLLTLTFATTTYAEEDTAEKGPLWYQIELLIYANESEGAEQAEQWSTDTSYPVDLDGIRLLHPVTDNKTNDQAQTEIKGSNVTTYPRSLEQEDIGQHISLLKKHNKSFLNYIDALDRTGTFRVLFHEVWRQPLTDNLKATPLIIEAGAQHNEYHELAGNITFSVNRYLHIKTNLTLNEFGTAIHSVDTYNFNNRQTNTEDLNADLNSLVFPEPVFTLGSPENPFAGTTEAEYIPIRTVALTQKRRMRSKELHYIDHPLMGLLVRLTPYEQPAPPSTVESLQVEAAQPIELDTLLNNN